MNTTFGNPPVVGTQTDLPTAFPAGPGPPDEIKRQIADAAIWLKFMAVLGFVGIGFMILAGFFVILIGLPDLGVTGHLIGLLYLVLGGVYLIPVLPLNRAASFAYRLKVSASHEAAVEALRSQATFWRRMGILSIVGIGLSIVSIPIAVIIGLASR